MIKTGEASIDTRIQVTLTVAEGKRVIAAGIASLPEVKNALQNGKVLLKGGTTVSAIAEILAGQPLKISGRFSPRGAKGTRHTEITGHSILLDHGQPEVVDKTLKEVVDSFGREDIILIGANAIDTDGNAAMCIGASLGGIPGEALSGMLGHGAKVIIACGLEKLIPGKIREAIIQAGRNTVDEAHGMAFGLVPIFGELITEREALMTLGKVSCTVIAKGGIDGAEGSTTFLIAGDSSEVQKVATHINQVKGCQESGIPESLQECEPGGRSCGTHKSCLYRRHRSGFTTI
ncbi:hypothetical protein [Desulfosporosinus metallidurans]|uniref:Uncharacterized protein n=1 Tax=Desulfosporosinus metallidurans TaxID=1888891 RepID=A0A1Q8QXB3_9FIRM|nr:hypothetical protein [Desulfosporosinus metallidurans]OLN31977.1 hypothetical protein DSOL_2070 [Desulfosporosinus metallidurans]